MNSQDSRLRIVVEIALVMATIVGIKQIADAFDVIGAGSLAMWCGVALTTLLMRYRGADWSSLGLAWPHGGRPWLKALAWAMITVVAIIAAMALIIEPVTGALGLETPASAADRFQFLIGHPWRLLGYLIVVVWIGAALGEELVMRGFLLNRLSDLFGHDRLGWIAAIVIQALIFGSLHAYQGWHGVIATSVIGAVMAVIYLACGRRLLPIVIGHGIMNTIILLVLYFHDGIVE